MNEQLMKQKLSIFLKRDPSLMPLQELSLLPIKKSLINFKKKLLKQINFALKHLKTIVN